MKNFKKEIIIISFIIIFVVGLNYITDKIMENAIYEINICIKEIEEKIDSNKENISIKGLKEMWEKDEKKLSCFSEHNELDKITTEVVSLEENLKSEDFEEAKINLAQIKYLLGHIEEKEKLLFKNVL